METKSTTKVMKVLLTKDLCCQLQMHCQISTAQWEELSLEGVDVSVDSEQLSG